MTSTPSRKLIEFEASKIIDHTEGIRELHLSLKSQEEFNFKAGQFVMLHVPVEGEAKPALRAYSIASDERIKNGFKLIFKYVENGIASNFVWKAKEKDVMNFTGPFGRVFFKEPPTEQIIFLNTGSGVAQHLSYLESKVQQYPNLKYVMYFGVRHEKDIYLQKDLEAIKANAPKFEYHYVLSRPSDSWQGRKGYVQDFIDEHQISSDSTTFYLCGNGGMIKAVKAKLEAQNFDKAKIFAEAFD